MLLTPAAVAFPIGFLLSLDPLMGEIEGDSGELLLELENDKTVKSIGNFKIGNDKTHHGSFINEVTA